MRGVGPKRPNEPDITMAEKLKKLQRQVVRKMDGHYREGDGKWLVRLEISAVRSLPSPIKHIKVVWAASDGGKPKGSTDICAVVSGGMLMSLHGIENPYRAPLWKRSSELLQAPER